MGFMGMIASTTGARETLSDEDDLVRVTFVLIGWPILSEMIYSVLRCGWRLMFDEKFDRDIEPYVIYFCK